MESQILFNLVPLFRFLILALFDSQAQARAQALFLFVFLLLFLFFLLFLFLMLILCLLLCLLLSLHLRRRIHVRYRAGTRIVGQKEAPGIRLDGGSLLLLLLLLLLWFLQSRDRVNLGGVGRLRRHLVNSAILSLRLGRPGRRCRRGDCRGNNRSFQLGNELLRGRLGELLLLPRLRASGLRLKWVVWKWRMRRMMRRMKR